jgi:hypothetical protein
MEARETRAFNVSEILQNQLPDAEGNLVPPSVHQGTAKIMGSHAENEYILVAAILESITFARRPARMVARPGRDTLVTMLLSMVSRCR